MKKILVILLSIALTGCSITASVSGITEKDEIFSGTATGYLSGKGIFEVITGAGAKCSGEYKYKKGLKGLGAAICNDGRQGDLVTLTETGVNGYGFVHFNDNTYLQFIFGDISDYSSLQWKTVKDRYKALSKEMASDIFYCEDFPLTPKCADIK